MDQKKFENAALFIRQNTEGAMTPTRLGLLLWLVDRTAFLCLGRTITGADYRRRRQGPMPDGLESLVEFVGANPEIS